MSSVCVPCFRSGHSECKALDDSTLCAHCEDGVPCPVAERKTKAAPAAAPIINKPKAPKVIPAVNNEETRTCSIPGCDKPLTSRNKTGRCTKHWYLAKGSRPTTSAKVKKPRQIVAAPVELRQTVQAAPDQTVPIYVHASLLNDWFQRQPLSDRAQMFQNWIEGK